jgi:hypothetical protein
VCIFTFLDTQLKNPEKEIIVNSLNKMKTTILDPKKLLTYDNFSKTISFIINVEENELTENKTEDILAAIDEIDKIPSTVTVGGNKRKRSSPGSRKSKSRGSRGSRGKTRKRQRVKSPSTEEREEIDKTNAPSDESKTSQPNDVFQVSDFSPAMRILENRSKSLQSPDLFFNAILQQIKRPKKMSGGQRKNLHNPLVTFYFLLRELSFRLSYEQDKDTQLLCKQYIGILETILNSEDLFLKESEKNIPSNFKNMAYIKYLYYSSFETFCKIFNRSGISSITDKMSYFDLKGSLPALLQVEDRTSMAASIESRGHNLSYRNG